MSLSASAIRLLALGTPGDSGQLKGAAADRRLVSSTSGIISARWVASNRAFVITMQVEKLGSDKYAT